MGPDLLSKAVAAGLPGQRLDPIAGPINLDWLLPMIPPFRFNDTLFTDICCPAGKEKSSRQAVSKYHGNFIM